MSFGLNAFLGDTPTQPITGNFPGITLFAQEPNGADVDIREINGAQWIAINAYFDQGLLQWTQSNAAKPSFAYVFGPAATFNIYTASAGSASPITWGSPVAHLP